ncbi:MAG: heme o synthase [Gemmatimonadota bacterium]
MTNARAFLQLTKPGITVFIGFTAAAGFVTALGGWGMPRQLGLMLAATMLMSGGAATLNHVAERNSDALMRRTAARPLPGRVISEARARAFGWALAATGLTTSIVFLPWATSLFLVLCHLSYVNAYTPLKRHTPLCTLAGAIPGALPVLAGWTATGQAITPAALGLTGVLFMWQIPHFLALGWMARDDYRSAGCPMLSVVDRTGRSSARVSLVYAVAMLACAAVVGLATTAGVLYMSVVVLTGMTYVVFAWRFVQERAYAPARRLFFSSLFVLPVLLSALIVDLVV